MVLDQMYVAQPDAISYPEIIEPQPFLLQTMVERERRWPCCITSCFHLNPISSNRWGQVEVYSEHLVMSLDHTAFRIVLMRGVCPHT